jgi:DNA-binding NarL/FixJ family response regulator
MKNNHQPAVVAGNKTRIKQAEARAQLAETRTEEAKSRTELAETRTEHAETRTELARTRTEQAEIRTEQAETRADQAETALQKSSILPIKTLSLNGIADRLTIRQREILQLVAEGQNTKQIAAILKVSPKTIEYHRMKFMNCLNIHDIPGLVRFALRAGLIAPET